MGSNPTGDQGTIDGLGVLAEWLERNSDEISVNLVRRARERMMGFAMADRDYKRRIKRLTEKVNALQQAEEDRDWDEN